MVGKTENDSKRATDWLIRIESRVFLKMSSNADALYQQIDESQHEEHAAASYREQRKLTIAVVLCMCFFAVELAGGWWTQSLALYSDSFHLLSDVISFAISLSAIVVSRWKPSGKYHFGYHRAEVLGAFLSLLVIWFMTVYLVYEAVERVMHPQHIKGVEMFVIALIGVLVNIVLGLTLHDFHHHHHHGHSHEHEHGTEESGHTHNNHEHSHGHGHSHGNMNLRAAVLHVIGDLLSSIGVLIASILIMVEELTHDAEHHNNRFLIADPICTFVFSIIVVGTTVPMLRQCLAVFMETCPKTVDMSELSWQVGNLPGVTRVKFVKVWALTMNVPAAIVAVEADLSIDAVEKLAKRPPSEAHTTSHSSEDELLTATDRQVHFQADEDDDEEEIPIYSESHRSPRLVATPAPMDLVESQQSYHRNPSDAPMSMQVLTNTPPCAHKIRELSIERRHNALVRKVKKILWHKFHIRSCNAFVTIELNSLALPPVADQNKVVGSNA